MASPAEPTLLLLLRAKTCRTTFDNLSHQCLSLFPRNVCLDAMVSPTLRTLLQGITLPAGQFRVFLLHFSSLTRHRLLDLLACKSTQHVQWAQLMGPLSEAVGRRSLATLLNVDITWNGLVLLTNHMLFSGSYALIVVTEEVGFDCQHPLAAAPSVASVTWNRVQPDSVCVRQPGSSTAGTSSSSSTAGTSSSSSAGGTSSTSPARSSPVAEMLPSSFLNRLPLQRKERLCLQTASQELYKNISGPYELTGDALSSKRYLNALIDKGIYYTGGSVQDEKQCFEMLKIGGYQDALAQICLDDTHQGIGFVVCDGSILLTCAHVCFEYREQSWTLLKGQFSVHFPKDANTIPLDAMLFPRQDSPEKDLLGFDVCIFRLSDPREVSIQLPTTGLRFLHVPPELHSDYWQRVHLLTFQPGHAKPSISSSSLLGFRGSEFFYDIHTSPGWSGSPLFNNSGDLIGIHRREGHARLTGGTSMYFNAAVRIDLFLNFLPLRELFDDCLTRKQRICLIDYPGLVELQRNAVTAHSQKEKGKEEAK
jgi:Trypsin-like peptidase domain